MHVLDFVVQKQLITYKPYRPLIADSVGHVYANFTFDEEWDGLSVTAVFKNSSLGTPVEVLLTKEQMEIPSEVLIAGHLFVSLVGSGDSGNIRVPTASMSMPIRVYRAGDLVGVAPDQHTPELWEQVLAAIGPLSKLDTVDKSNLVTAINEALRSVGDLSASTVSVNPQEFPDDKKAQARANIGAADAENTYLKYTDREYSVEGTGDFSSPQTTRWAMYFERSFPRIKIFPLFTDPGETFDWTRFECNTSIANGVKPATVISSGKSKVGDPLVLTDVTEYTVIEVAFFKGSGRYFHNILDEKPNPPVHCATLHPTFGTLQNVSELKDFYWAGTFVVSEQIDLVSQKAFDSMTENLKKLASPYHGTRWAVFGDSLTEKNERAEIQYFDYISDNLGIKVTKNYGDSGTGYMQRQSDGLAFYQRILSIDPDAFDVLTIFGSGNDHNNTLGTATDTGTTTIGGCINKTIDNFYSIAPFKKIGLITPTPWAGYEPTDPGNKMEQYSNLLVEICKMRGIPCLDLYHCSGLRPGNEEFRVQFYNENGLQDPGIHPNSAGHKFFAPMVREFIKALI